MGRGEITAAERSLIVKFARSRGIDEHRVADEQLARWMTHRPDQTVFQGARRLVTAVLSADSSQAPDRLTAEDWWTPASRLPPPPAASWGSGWAASLPKSGYCCRVWRQTSSRDRRNRRLRSLRPAGRAVSDCDVDVLQIGCGPHVTRGSRTSIHAVAHPTHRRRLALRGTWNDRNGGLRGQ